MPCFTDMLHVFFYKKNKKNDPQKLQNLKIMLRKSPALMPESQFLKMLIFTKAL